MPANHLNGNGARPGTASHSPVFHQPSQPTSAPKQTPVSVPVPGAADGVKPPVVPVTSDIPQGTQSASPQLSNNLDKKKRFHDDYARLSAAIQEADPDAVRRAIRDNHPKCLLGSHYHLAFLMNVTMHQADVGIFQRAVRDFGARFLEAGKHELVNAMTPADIDEVADKILAKASDTFLDRALVARLRTIQARRLVNALARAERLGYDAADIVENEHVIPSLPGTTPAAPAQQQQQQQQQQQHLQHQQQQHQQLQQQQQVALARTNSFQSVNQKPELPVQPLEPADPANPQCIYCHRTFPGVSAYQHHVKKKICVKTSPLSRSTSEAYMCPHCAQRFGGMAGLQYHMLNKVCGDFGEVIKDDIASIPKSSLPPPILNPPVKRPAPASDSTPTYITSGTNSPAHTTPMPSNSQTPRASSQAVDLSNAPLGTPQHKDMAHLTVHQIEALKGELQLAEEQFKMKIDAAQKAGGDPDELQKKLAGFKNSYACKQSTIRKKYGIKLRQRRNREEMEAERQRMGIPDGVPRTIPTPSKEGHADKRARLNGEGDASTTQTSRNVTPIQTVAVTDMANGLNGSNATAATQDPTASMSQPPASAQPMASRPPPSTYHQGNYRVEVHVPSPSKKIGAAAPDESLMDNTPSRASSSGGMTAEQLLKQMRGGAGAPIELNDEESSSESDSSSDEEE
ncbi:hypothetical protein BDP55DRAFT_690789 [Colletotrichum godetiae]|uniref:Uncharacterized protein n=1 Tax=Colletotrichum godetiae TaxID=1209918 RepID=A0AAJ0F0U9_9PEZI|nr:uncharacterized protein BDP55DRAFT_690789 [Colletotrichum godetiae]KAK1691061.1 hypothetical protein BDP55DRAFT_690789 [Colletotrichum godetiae]